MRTTKRLLTALVAATTAWGATLAQGGLSVTVNVETPGTLFQLLHEQLDGNTDFEDELLAVGHLTLSGTLNNDDRQVLANRLLNLLTADVSGLTKESIPYTQFHLKRLRSVKFPADWEQLSSSCLEYCDSLTDVTLPTKLKELPYCCFEECKSLQHIVIPDSVTTISMRAFLDCSSLTTVVVPEGVTIFNSDCFRNCESLSQINIPSTLETIGGSTFMNTALTSITLPASMKKIDSHAFRDCKHLQRITFPDGLTGENDLGSYVLYNCPALTTVTLPSGLKVLPDYTFGMDTLMTSFNLPPTVERIGHQAFYQCKGLKQFTIPASVKQLGDEVFRESGLQSFSWPGDKFSIIPNGTFRGCEGLKSITLPATVDSIGSYTFYGCKSLTALTLPEGLRVVANDLCEYCSSLTQVHIPQSVYYIGSCAFDSCPLTQVDIPDGVTYIGSEAFEGCPLTEVNLPSKIVEIGRSAFNSDTYSRVVVPEGCLRIYQSAFQNKNLQYIDLPSTVNAVQAPLHNDAKPDSIVIRAAMPPEYGIYSQWYTMPPIFFGTNATADIYVPQSSLATYQAAWGSFAPNIKPLTGYDPETIYVFNYLTIDNQSGYQQQKHDMMLMRSDGDFPTAGGLTVEEGTNLQIGNFQLDFDYEVEHWWNDRRNHNIASLINHGAMKADQMAYTLNFGGEKLSAIFTPPFDVRVSDITKRYDSQPVLVRRYDGAARARGDFDHTWVDLQPSEVLRAGEGYAIYTGYSPVKNGNGRWIISDRAPLTLKPLAGGKNYVFEAGNITVPLKPYVGEFAHNSGWNLVGIPYSSYFDLRGIDYDGPVLLTYGSRWTNQMFRAVSPLDDEYVFIPLSAIFMQAPEGMNSLTFLQKRRQHNSTYVPGEETTNNARALRRADQRRLRVVYDATLLRQSEPGGEELATTRFVINPDATVRYDIGRDAPCVAPDSVPALLYTQASGVAYAINERPLGDGIVRLGLQLAESGTYTLSLRVRGEAFPASQPVWLIDNEEHTRTLLNPSTSGETNEGFTFTAAAGIYADRFVIALGDADPTAITDVEAATPMRPEGLFNLGGQRISEPRRGLNIENGRIVFRK